MTVPPVAFVQSGSANAAGVPANVTLTTTLNNLLIAVWHTNQAAVGVTNPTGFTVDLTLDGVAGVHSLFVGRKSALGGSETFGCNSIGANQFLLMEFTCSGLTNGVESPSTLDAATGTSIQPGSVPITRYGNLLIAAAGTAGVNGGSEAIDSNFTILEAATLTMMVAGYKIKEDGVAENPTLSWATSRARNAFIIPYFFARNRLPATILRPSPFKPGLAQ